ncbi:hypothetical protein EV178_003110 [Coemansia sp. RSA 1646]|nr:hypothetical protein EV178_003110 [Coemansia sp. RSA 1646]
MAVSSGANMAAFRRVVDLYSHASNARFNSDKAEVLCIVNPAFTIPYDSPQGNETIRYLGILFSGNSVAVDQMEGKIHNDIQARIERWGDRCISQMGRGMLANTVLLAKMWHAAHIVLIKEFYAEVMYTLGDLFMRDPVSGADITKDNIVAERFVTS